MTSLESKLALINLELPEVDEAAVTENKKRLERDFPGLLEFDPREEYAYGDVKHDHITVANCRVQMERIAELIARMVERGATAEELGRAIRHSFVVCDATKHDLDWRKSMKDFGIRALEEKYSRA